jgi:hypothetical protein
MPPKFRAALPAPFRPENGCIVLSDEDNTSGACVTQGHKWTNERTCEDFAAIERLGSSKRIVCVLDGHAGATCAAFAREKLMESARILAVEEVATEQAEVHISADSVLNLLHFEFSMCGLGAHICVPPDACHQHPAASGSTVGRLLQALDAS